MGIQIKETRFRNNKLIGITLSEEEVLLENASLPEVGRFIGPLDEAISFGLIFNEEMLKTKPDDYYFYFGKPLTNSIQDSPGEIEILIPYTVFLGTKLPPTPKERVYKI